MSKVMSHTFLHVPYFLFILTGLFYAGHLPVKPALKDLMKELYTTSSDKWENIGIFLEIEQGKLDAIKAAENQVPQNCLREMLKIWLKRVSPPPSWSAIAEAIELLGDQNLAHRLKTNYHTPKLKTRSNATE